MSLLSYDVVADPAPLASRTGTPAVGTVHVLVSNPNTYHVKWHSIEVEVPFGSGTGALTSDHTVITPKITPEKPFAGGANPTFGWDPTRGTPGLSGLPGAFIARDTKEVDMPPGSAMVLSLENFPVSDQEGLVLLRVNQDTEGSSRGRTTRPVRLAALKKATQVPTDFRPDKPQVDKRQNLGLLWDGPDDLTYTLALPRVSTTPGPPIHRRTDRTAPSPLGVLSRDVGDTRAGCLNG